MKNPIAETVSHPKHWNEKKYSYSGRAPALTAPTSLTRTIVGNTAVLQWTPSTSYGQVKVQRSLNSGVTFTDVVTLNATTTTYTDNISSGNTYYWRVVAVVGSDTSSPSNVVSYSLTGFNIANIIVDDVNGKLTIEGSGFGVMGGDVLHSVRGDEHAHDTIAQGAASSVGPAIRTNIVGLGQDTAGDYIRYSNAAGRAGRSVGIRRTHTGVISGTSKPGGFGRNGMSTTKYYMSYFRRANTTWNDTNTFNYKQFYTFGNYSGGAYNSSPQTMLFIPSSQNSVGFYNNNPVSSDANSVQNMMNTVNWRGSQEVDTWHRWEIYADYANTPTIRNGKLRVWRNKQLGINSDTWVGRGPGVPDDSYTHEAYVGYMDLNMTGSFDFSDFYFADTMVRVELGDAPTWGACTKTQIQVVTASNWTDNEINNITFDLADIPEDSAYIYVIGPDGVPFSTTGYKLQQQPQLIVSQDFAANTNGIVDSHAGQNLFRRVTNNAPKGKTHSIRFNLKNGVTDPITLQPGNNLYTAEFKPVSSVPTFDVDAYDQLTWIGWFRYDDALWGGQADPLGINGTLVHIGHENASSAEKGFCLTGSAMGGEFGQCNIADNWSTSDSPWFGWQNRTYGWRNGSNAPTNSIYATTGQSWGADGKWHELRIQFDLYNGGLAYSRARVLIDRVPLKVSSDNFDGNGWFKLPPKTEFKPSVLRLGNADATSVGAAINRAGTAAGVQWGAFELWDSIVDNTEPLNTQPTLVPLPSTQFWLGDSQITGAAGAVSPLCRSNRTAFMALWQSFYSSALNDTTARNLGLGGRGIIVNSSNVANTGHYHALQGVWGTTATPRTGPEWVHYVETGNQDLNGQRTAVAYGDNFEAMVRWIFQKSPNCIFSTETPHSFDGIGVTNRDWTTYETEVRVRVNKLAQEGIKVHLVENRALIDALVAKLGASTVWYTDSTVNTYRHFTAVGNLLTAVAIYWTMGHDINSLNFAPIIAEGAISQAQIDAILEVVNGQ